MAVQLPSIPIPLGGVVTRGSPLDRPQNSSIICRNFRVMPGANENRKPYLRLRGGKVIRFSGGADDRHDQFYDFRKSTQAGTRYSICQRLKTGGTHHWTVMNIDSTPYTLTDAVTISTSYGFLNGQLAGRATTRDKLMMYNGLGVRDGSTSKPPFTTFDGSVLRYCGLDAYCVGGNPTVASAGGGNNTFEFGCSIYVGLHNTVTQHFSNAVFAGRIGITTSSDITVSNLDRLKPVYLNATEQAELVYVFYATIDGGQVAYMILNSGLTGPLTASIASTTKSLSVTSSHPQGFILDPTQERPTENYPPRPMSLITYANGRIYGILKGGGSGTAGFLADQPAPGTTDNSYYRDFQYVLTQQKDVGSVVWSAAADQTTGNDFVGVPEESFPYRNRKYTPNGEFPYMIDAAPGDSQVLVITATGTFILSEAADGLHEWTTISDTDGLIYEKAYCRTPRGPMWITQNKQLVLLDKDTFQLKFLSAEFDALLSASYYGSPQAACAYLRDAQNDIDCFKVWRSSEATGIVYDFTLGGMAYEEETWFNTVAAGTLFDTFGNKHFVQASARYIYTQDTDPFVHKIPVADAKEGSLTVQVSATYQTQWLSSEDKREMMRLTDLNVIGDVAASDSIDASPLSVSVYYELDPEEHTLDLEKTQQCESDLNFKDRLRDGNLSYLKIKLAMVGHSADLSAAYYPDSDSATGELTPTSYGCIYELSALVTPTRNQK